jgi:hypothetical protein
MARSRTYEESGISLKNLEGSEGQALLGGQRYEDSASDLETPNREDDLASVSFPPIHPRRCPWVG